MVGVTLTLVVMVGDLTVMLGDLTAVVGTELPWFLGDDVVMPFSTDGTCEQTLAGWSWVSTHRSPTR